MSFGRVGFPRIGDDTAAFRAVVDLSAPGQRVRLMVEMVLFTVGRAELNLTTTAALSAAASVRPAEVARVTWPGARRRPWARREPIARLTTRTVVQSSAPGSQSCTFVTESAQTGDYSPGTVGVMNEAARVLERLERIDALDRERAPADRLLDELRALVREAEAWARTEGDARAGVAAARLTETLGGRREGPLESTRPA